MLVNLFIRAVHKFWRCLSTSFIWDMVYDKHTNSHLTRYMKNIPLSIHFLCKTKTSLFVTIQPFSFYIHPLILLVFDRQTDIHLTDYIRQFISFNIRILLMKQITNIFLKTELVFDRKTDIPPTHYLYTYTHSVNLHIYIDVFPTHTHITSPPTHYLYTYTH